MDYIWEENKMTITDALIIQLRWTMCDFYIKCRATRAGAVYSIWDKDCLRSHEICNKFDGAGHWLSKI